MTEGYEYWLNRRQFGGRSRPISPDPGARSRPHDNKGSQASRAGSVWKQSKGPNPGPKK